MWIVVLLISIVSYFMTREINSHDKAHDNLLIVVNELKDEIHELRETQRTCEDFLKKSQESFARLESRMNAHLKQEERK